MARWTIAPSSTAIVDAVLRRLGDLRLVDPAVLAGAEAADGPQPRDRAGLLAALAADLDDALEEADQTVAMLLRSAGPALQGPEQRREHGRRLVLAARIQRRAAHVAALRQQIVG